MDDLSDLLGPEPDAQASSPVRTGFLEAPEGPACRARIAAPKFLELMAQGYSPTRAAAAVGVHRTAFYHLRERWPEFNDAWLAANEAAVDVLEDAAVERAVRGVPRKVFFQGEHIDTVREYSDSLLALLLKGRAPERYRERYDVNQHVDVRVDHATEILAARQRAGIIIDAVPTSPAHIPTRLNSANEGGADVSVRREPPTG